MLDPDPSVAKIDADAAYALSVFESILGGVDAFVYRCRNDDVYTMDFMLGQVPALCGRPARDVLGNRVVAFTDMVHPEDKAAMFADVDRAIEAGGPWNILYRFQFPNGSERWVRERGRAVFDHEGSLQFLEGLIVGAQAEVDLRQRLETTLVSTHGNYKEILEIAEEIIKSVHMLSLLSVNAQVEAARAGESGRGFAVVAREISALATANSDRAKRITQKLQTGGRQSPSG